MDQSRESAVAPRRLVILGSTGSIGRQALEVLAAVSGCELVSCGLAAKTGAEAVTAIHTPTAASPLRAAFGRLIPLSFRAPRAHAMPGN